MATVREEENTMKKETSKVFKNYFKNKIFNRRVG